MSGVRTDAIARGAARGVVERFSAFQDDFRAAAQRTARHFAARDWRAAQQEAASRLGLYKHHVDAAVAETQARLGPHASERVAWTVMRSAFAAGVVGRPDGEIARTFFNSVTRRVFTTVGVDYRIEFAREEEWELPELAACESGVWCDGAEGPRALAAAVLACASVPFADAHADASRVGDALAAALRNAWGDERCDGAAVLPYLFYRNKGAYLVGRLRRGERMLPLVVALVHEPTGVVADAVLTTSDEASIVFGFAWSYFHVDAPCPGATVRFLAELMPHKRVDELYTALGYNKHGKTELYRALRQHMEAPDARFVEAEGTKGLVMSVFTLPSLNIVFKIIKDVVDPPKRTTRREVMEKYQFVFVRDRVGRLADAQEFEHLAFRRRCFPDALLAELRRVAPSMVREAGDWVIVRQLYTERRLRPLDLHLAEVDAAEAERSITDYGQAIRDLAAADIFTGDLLLKNFGVSRHGRVIFYDYDELSTVTECHFRTMPQTSDTDDELAAEPWFSVGEHDVFPEEFAPFLVPPGPLRDVFMSTHAELLDPAWWRAIQDRLRAGEIFDTYPYREERRLKR